MKERSDITIHHYKNAFNEACRYLSDYISKDLGIAITQKQIRQLLLEDQGVRFYNKISNGEEYGRY